MTEEKLYDVICIGAGPAGLSAGYVLSKDKKSILVLEASEKYVGGISRTEEYNGYLCDIGGHRFFSKSQEIEDIWQEILGEDFLQRPRKSRIYYNGKFFDYPLRAFDALKKLGPINSGLCVLSYFRSALLPVQNPKTFEDWVSNKFGKRLFNILSLFANSL